MTITNTEAVSDERLAEMLAGLEGVTPGPWRHYTPDAGYCDDYVVTDHPDHAPDEKHRFRHLIATTEAATLQQQATGKHIARCDPDTIRYLVTQELSRRAANGAGGVEVKALTPPQMSFLRRLTDDGFGMSRHMSASERRIGHALKDKGLVALDGAISSAVTEHGATFERLRARIAKLHHIHDAVEIALHLLAVAALTRLIAERDGLREANRKLHRRAQKAEGVAQSVFDTLQGWVDYFKSPASATPRSRERHLFRWVIVDTKRRAEKAVTALSLDTNKGDGV